MRSIRLINPMLRAIGVIGVVAGLVTGVTFAALNDQATLGPSTMSTATANLTLFDGTGFATEAPGFTITNVVPGTGSGEQPFYFKNGGAVALKITAHVPVAPAEPAGGYGFSNFENVKVTFTNKHDAVAPVHTTMAALMAGEVALPGEPLSGGAQGDGGNPTAEGNYTATFDIDPSAVTGDHAGIGNFDIVFTGTQPTVPVVPEP